MCVLLMLVHTWSLDGNLDSTPAQIRRGVRGVRGVCEGCVTDSEAHSSGSSATWQRLCRTVVQVRGESLVVAGSGGQGKAEQVLAMSSIFSRVGAEASCLQEVKDGAC